MQKSYLTILISFVYISVIAQTPDWEWANRIGGTNHDNARGTTTDPAGNVFMVGECSSQSFIIGTDTFNQPAMYIVKYDSGGNLLWNKTAVGSGWPIGVVADSAGNIYVAGNFGSDSITFGTLSIYSKGLNDIFIVKYDSSGNEIWAKSAGGLHNDDATSCAIDKQGNIYITGGAYSDFTFAADSLSNVVGRDVFLLKYNAMGDEIWARGAGSNATDYGNKVSTDTLGNVFLCGYYTSSIIFENDTLYDSTTGTFNGNIFLVKYTSGGTVLWTKALQTDASHAGAVTTDNQGNVYLTGWFHPDSISIASISLTNGSGYCVFIVKYSSSGHVQWAKKIPAVGCTNSNLVTDELGNLYTTGYFYDTFTIGTYTLTNSDPNAANSDYYIIKFDSSGNVIWAKSLGGLGQELISSISLDNAGNLVVAGYFGYVNFPSMTLGTTTLLNAGGSDAFIARLGPVTEGITEKNNIDQLAVYPNPASQQLTVDLQNSTIENCIIINALGQTVYNGANQINANHKIQLNISNLKAGVYFVKVRCEHGSYTVKFVKSE